jgi:hypothetical protein
MAHQLKSMPIDRNAATRPTQQAHGNSGAPIKSRWSRSKAFHALPL